MRKHRRHVIEVDPGLGEKYQISQTGVDRRGKPDAKDVVHRWKVIQLPGTAPIAGPLCYQGSGPWHVSCTMEAKRVTCPKCLELMNGAGGPVTLDKIVWPWSWKRKGKESSGRWPSSSTRRGESKHRRTTCWDTASSMATRR